MPSFDIYINYLRKLCDRLNNMQLNYKFETIYPTYLKEYDGIDYDEYKIIITNLSNNKKETGWNTRYAYNLSIDADPRTELEKATDDIKLIFGNLLSK